MEAFIQNSPEFSLRWSPQVTRPRRLAGEGRGPGEGVGGGHGGVARAFWEPGAAETSGGSDLGSAGRAQLAQRGAIRRGLACKPWCPLWLGSWGSCWWPVVGRNPCAPATPSLLSASPGLGIPVQPGPHRKQFQANSRLSTLQGNVEALARCSFSLCPRSQAPGRRRGVPYLGCPERRNEVGFSRAGHEGPYLV